MKKRLGFVTNSSSSNSIISAVVTAATSGITAAVLNVETADVKNQIVETVNLKIEVETSHPEKCLRLNDPYFTANVFASVKHTVTKYEANGGSLDILSEENSYADSANIEFVISEEAKKWIGMSEPIMVGESKAIAIVGESIHYENRRFQPEAPSTIAIGVRCRVGEYELSDSVQIRLLEDAMLCGYSTYVLNDSETATDVPIAIFSDWPYTWQVEFQAAGNKLSEYCQMQIEDTGEEITQGTMKGKKYKMIVTPSGKKIPTEKPGAVSIQERIDLKGTPNDEAIANLTDFLDLTLIEEGLFFEGDTDTKGNLIVESYIKSKEETAPKEIVPTRFKLTCVVKNEEQKGLSGNTAKFLNLDKVELTFGELIGTSEKGEKLSQIYKYDIEKTNLPGTYVIKPMMSIPFSDQPITMILPVSCELDMIGYELEIPLVIQGQPFGHTEAWEQELKNLFHMIVNYVAPEKQLDIIEEIKRHQDRLSVESLRLRRRNIWEDARKDLLDEAKDYMETAELLEWAECGAGALKWAGDQAFAYLMYYWGGQLAEAFLVPFKDIVVTLIGELSAEAFWGSGTMSEEQMYTANLNSIISSVENEIVRDFDLKDINLKKIGRYFAALATVNFMKHYFLDTKPDGTPIGFWDALISTCSDLSVNYFKAMVGSKFDELMKMPETKEFFEKYASKYIKELVFKMTDNFNVDQLNTIGKYLSEITGVVTATVNGEVIDLAKKTNVSIEGYDVVFHIEIDKNVTVDVSLMKIKDELFDYMFDLIFSSFPYAPNGKKLNTPNMPPYYRT